MQFACCWQQLTDETEEMKASSVLAKEEAAAAKQQLEQARTHIETIESKLQAALLEVEAVKASEESALSQVSLVLIFRYLLRSSVLNQSWYTCVKFKGRPVYCDEVSLGYAMVMSNLQ